MQGVHLVCKECINRVSDLLIGVKREQRELRPGGRCPHHQEVTKRRRTRVEECKECRENLFSINTSNRFIEILEMKGVHGKSKYSKRSRS
jgi:hypothetical protein